MDFNAMINKVAKMSRLPHEIASVILGLGDFFVTDRGRLSR
jgi:hypothetical protein